MTRRRMTGAVVALALGATVLATANGGSAVAGAAVSVQLVKGGLNDPAAFTFTPKGIVVYLERGTGRVRFLNPTTGFDRVFFRIKGVNGSGERGALGVALHPRWPAKKLVYAYVTRATSRGLRNQIVKIRSEGNTGAGLEVLLSTPASASPYHNGGRILFGPDRMLYAMIGDGHNPANAQDRSANLRGKIIRLRPDGRVAPGNPGAKKYWTYGMRNSFGMAFDDVTDRLWETENGPSCNDEINLIVKNGNFGWGPRQSCGSLPTPRDTNNSGPTPRRLPRAWYSSPIGITGMAFCGGCGLGGGTAGDLFYGSVGDPSIRRYQMNAARNDVVGGPIAVTTPPNGVVYSMEVAPDGTIFFSDYEAIYRLTP